MRYRSRSVSPLRRRYRRSPTSQRRRSPFTDQHRPSIPNRKRSPTPPRSPDELSSQSPIDRASDSPVRRISPAFQSSPVQSPRHRIRMQEQSSPVRHTPPRDNTERSIVTRKGSTLDHRTQMSSVRSPEGVPTDRNSLRGRVPSMIPSQYNSVSGSESPPPSKIKRHSEDMRSNSPHECPPSQTRESLMHDVRPSPPEKPKVHNNLAIPQVENVQVSSKVEDEKTKSYGEKLVDSTSDEHKVLPLKVKYNVKGSGRHETENMSNVSKKVEDRNNLSDTDDSDYEASDKHRDDVNVKRKHKRSKRHESDDGHSDSELEGRKEAKRRKKEEKRLRKEERRRRREERRHKKEERRAGKTKLKSVGTVSPPSDLERNHVGYSSDSARVPRRDSRSSDNEEEESEQMKLEIALREKALETLRAKKGSGR